MKHLSQEEWKQQVNNDENAVVLDVRTADEMEEGYVPNAMNIDIYQGQGFLDGLEELDKSKNYYVYCRSGNRSAQACTIMESVGFASTHNLMGGFNEWEGEVVQ